MHVGLCVHMFVLLFISAKISRLHVEAPKITCVLAAKEVISLNGNESFSMFISISAHGFRVLFHFNLYSMSVYALNMCSS